MKRDDCGWYGGAMGGLTSEFTRLRAFSRRSGGMMGLTLHDAQPSIDGFCNLLCSSEKVSNLISSWFWRSAVIT